MVTCPVKLILLVHLANQVVGDFSSKLGWALETLETIAADRREMVRKPGVKAISEVLDALAPRACCYC